MNWFDIFSYGMIIFMVGSFSAITILDQLTNHYNRHRILKIEKNDYVKYVVQYNYLWFWWKDCEISIGGPLNFIWRKNSFSNIEDAEELLQRKIQYYKNKKNKKKEVVNIKTSVVSMDSVITN